MQNNHALGRTSLAALMLLTTLPFLAQAQSPRYGKFVCHRDGCTEIIENRDGLADT